MDFHYSSTPPQKIKNISIAIGFFDGFHIGHQELIKELRAGNGWVMSFYPHPIQLLKKDEGFGLLFQRDDLIDELRKKNIQGLWLVPFTEEFSKLREIDFFNKMILPLKPQKIVVGEDFKFGFKASGNVDTLIQMGRENNVEVIVVPKLRYQGREVSSTWLRNCLQNADLKTFKVLMGRNYITSGVVIQGDKIARNFGFPTANLYPDKNFLLKKGVYSAKCRIDGNEYLAVVNVGRKPTFSTIDNFLIEAHVLNFSRNIYGEVIVIEWIERIRDEMKFESIESLTNQIKKDIAKVVNYESAN